MTGTTRRRTGLTVATLWLGVVWAASLAGQIPAASGKAAQKTSVEALLGQALQQEEIEGNPRAAIASYQKVIAAPDATRAQAARAQFRIGACYERLGLAEARKAYELVISQYGDQGEFAAQARARLSAMASGGRTAPAGGTGPRTRALWKGVDWSTGEISPDGTMVAFSDWAMEDLWVRDVATGTDRRLTKKGPDDGGAIPGGWSPDSTRLAYDWNEKDTVGWFNEIRIVDVRSGAITAVPGSRRAGREGGDPGAIRAPKAWAPDGTRLLVHTGDFLSEAGVRLAWLSLKDGSLTELTSIKGHIGGIVISPDGAFVAYSMSRVSTYDPHFTYVAASDGSANELLVGGPAGSRPVAWTPDGSGLLYKGERSGVRGLWLVPITNGKAAGEPTRVSAVGDNLVAGLTKSGALLYATSDSRHDIWLATVDLPSARVHQKKRVDVPAGAVVSEMGSFSPDGSLMAYSVTVGRKSGLVFAASDGSNPRLVLPAAVTLTFPRPTWSADARTLYVGGYPEPSLTAFMKVDVSSGAIEPLFEPFKIEHRAPGDRVSWLAGVSADGKTAYYEKLDSAKRSASLWKRDVASGAEQELFRSAGRAGLFPLRLSPDGSRLAFNLVSFPSETTKRTHLMTLSLVDGSTRTVCELPETLIMMSSAWSPDGRYIVYAQDLEATTELHIVDASGGQPTSLGVTADQIRGVAIHPDGRHMAFATRSEGATEYWLLENFLPPAKLAAPKK